MLKKFMDMMAAYYGKKFLNVSFKFAKYAKVAEINVVYTDGENEKIDFTKF